MLVLVCGTTAAATAMVQRDFLMRDLDERVTEAAERCQWALDQYAGDLRNLGFLKIGGQTAGTLAARLDRDGHVVAAAVVTDAGHQRSLSTAQRTALEEVPADGARHTLAVPGFGDYRLVVLGDGEVPVLAGLPTADVERMNHALMAVEAVIAVVGLTLSGTVCAVVVRRRLRPLRRVAATAAEATRIPLDRGEVTGLCRVPAEDTDPRTETGQVGLALNRLIEHVEKSLVERRHTEERMRRLLADASHELRTPLASIAGYAQLMAGGTGQVTAERAWERITAQSARMTGLVDDLLLLAHLDEGRPLELAEVNVATLVAESVWDARAAGGDRSWQVFLRLDASVSVVGDHARLQQVLANLLGNARAHTPAGTRITVTAWTTDTHCLIRVHDDGPGIPGALLPQVFERFTRADASRSRSAADRTGGAGLGLAIAAAITRAHGGRLDARSVPGDTEFTVSLPLDAPQTCWSQGCGREPVGTGDTGQHSVSVSFQVGPRK
ncbi:sensor histidine kinase [Streptomyces sp. CRN 30]|uniref:sensor histidine kinase n=1 Tax=Streptomyces sp. CRN 30 TaxID=3075613 RepID=UPI002A81B7AE|nr:ATP-binding protein [Streptomyces sp. CRN 30]